MSYYIILGHALAFFIIVFAGVSYELKRESITAYIKSFNLRDTLFFFILLPILAFAIINLLFSLKVLFSVILMALLILIFIRPLPDIHKREYLSHNSMIISFFWLGITFFIFKSMEISNTFEAGLLLQIAVITVVYLIVLIALWYGGIPRYIFYWSMNAIFLLFFYSVPYFALEDFGL